MTRRERRAAASVARRGGGRGGGDRGSARRRVCRPASQRPADAPLRSETPGKGGVCAQRAKTAGINSPRSNRGDFFAAIPPPGAPPHHRATRQFAVRSSVAFSSPSPPPQAAGAAFRPPAGSARGRPRAQTRPETRKVGHFFAQRPAPPRPPAPHRRARAPARPIPPLCPKTGAKTGPCTANAPLHGAESIRRPQTAGVSLPGFPERARLWVGDRLTNSWEHSMCRFPAPPHLSQAADQALPQPATRR